MHVLLLAAAVLLPSPVSAGGAFEELTNSSPGYEAPLPAAAPVNAVSKTAAKALAVIQQPDGDIFVLTKRQAPLGLRELPDDAIREERPTAAEVLPVPAPGRSGVMKTIFPTNFDEQKIIPADLKASALEYYLANRDKIGNLRYIGVLDFSRHSSVARFYIADVETGGVKAVHVAHGSGSDPDHDGFADIFSNKNNSNASSLGFYLTGEIYTGKHGRSMRLHGLSATNSNAYERAVVIHAAAYVRDEAVKQGRSWGCPAVSTANRDHVINALKGGALIYAGLSGSSK